MDDTEKENRVYDFPVNGLSSVYDTIDPECSICVFCLSQRRVQVPVVKLVNRSTIHFIRSLLQECHLDAKVGLRCNS